MDERELFKRVYTQILGYGDDEIVSRWGFDVYQTLTKRDDYQHDLYLFVGREQSLPFMCAVSTAFIVGGFGREAFGRHFDYFPEVEIELALLGMEFKQIKDFIDEDIKPEHLQNLEKRNVVGLGDMWSELWEWVGRIYFVLSEKYKQQNEKYPDYELYLSLLKAFETYDEEEGENWSPSFTEGGKMQAYNFVSNGFQY